MRPTRVGFSAIVLALVLSLTAGVAAQYQPSPAAFRQAIPSLASPLAGQAPGEEPGSGLAPARGLVADTGSVLRDLRSVLDTGLVLQDRNADGVVDFVDASILLPRYPNEVEVAAAANLGARLGYETSAINLGLAGEVDIRRPQDRPVILMGAGAVDGAGLADHTDPLRGGLGPGQGVLAHFPAMGAFEGGVVAVVGYDATGLLDGAGYLSSRYPDVWAPGGTTWREVAEKVEAFVGAKLAGAVGAGAGEVAGVGGEAGAPAGETAAPQGTSPAAEEVSVTLDRIVVDATRPGVARARVTVRVSDEAAYQALVEAFLGLDTLKTEEGVGVGETPDSAAAVAGAGAAGRIAAVADSFGVQGADTAATPLRPDPADAGTWGPQTEPADSAPTLSDLEFEDLHRLDVRLLGPGVFETIPLRPKKPWNTRAGEDFRRSGDTPFSLPDLYRVDGLYRDTNRDLVPDETVAYLSLSGAAAAPSVVDLATRIGLETAGIRLPLARVAAQEDDPTEAGLPILLGTDHYQIRRLQEEGKLTGWRVGEGEEGVGAGEEVVREGDQVVGPGEGFVELVDHAFGERSALAVGGGDADGLQAATDWLARRVPYLWTYGKGEYRLADAETEVRRFLQAREAPGQVALALSKLGAWMDRMAADPSREGSAAALTDPSPGNEGGTRTLRASDPSAGKASGAPARIEVELSAAETPTGLDEVAASVVRDRFPDAEIQVTTWPTGFGVGDTIFAHDWEIPWEVDDARRILAEEVYPALQPGLPAEIELRVSESPEIRGSLEAEIRSELADRGIPDATVRVLSAYKQGYSWIHDVLLPQLRDRGVASIQLVYHTLEESEEVRWQTIAAETRWLQEVFPFDAVLARELGIPDSVVTFRPTRQKDPIYTFEARDASGEIILRDTFTPKYVVRPFFDLFPEYEQIRVTTGWIKATSGDRTLADQRIVTDPERFWDRLQTEAYGEIIQYVMDSQNGSPSPANAPYFDVFQVDLRLSEPNYRIGIDEEGISSLEALHEDVFFETHTLFDLIGGRYQTDLPFPGRVLPYMDPGGEGQPGRARITFTGKTKGTPELVVRSWPEEGSEPLLKRYPLSPLPVEAPRLVGATLTSGEEGLRRLLARVAVTDSLDRFLEFEGRSSEGAIDRQFISAELLAGMTRALGRLHDAGLFQDALSWDRVGTLALDFRMEKDSTFQRSAALPRSANPGSTANPRLFDEGYRSAGEPLVQWETPISPEENEAILGRLATFPGVDVYYLTDSYLGHRVWAADFLPPQEGEYVSQAKLNALKPTLFISGREHANEVSSTSHILRLGELLVTDSVYMDLLKKVNVVLHPITNPDGAALAYERQLVNPTHMLHAGRPGALGVDATSGGRGEDPIYPEARARHLIQEAWLPDAYLNPHGYPSHEWVQYFAGYSAWVRSRSGGARDWWVPRSWFIPGFSWVDDEENPDYKTAQFAILDTMAAAMTSNVPVDAANRRLYARYRKYGVQDREGFTEYFHKGMLVNMRLRGSESIGNGLYSPRITYFSATTEAPDEPARGAWMQLMGQAGLTHTSALLRYLATGEFEVEREAEAFQGAVTRKVYRVKPVMPGGKEGKDGAGKEDGGRGRGGR